jgi:ribosomal protein S18 acetylase RimI-like enzyme
MSENSDIDNFESFDSDLTDFLKEDALESQNERLSATKLVYWKSELVGFFTLVNDCLQAERINSGDGCDNYSYSKYPAIKIARLSTHKNYERMGIGLNILDEIMATSIYLSEQSGCRLITVDSKKESIGFYEKYDFRQAKGKVHDTTPMYLDFHRLLKAGSIDE